MKLAVLAAAAALGLGVLGANVSTAEAAGGCGPGFHRNPYGYCRPNFGYGPRFARPYGFYHRGYDRGYGYRDGWHRGWRHGPDRYYR